MGKGLDVFAMVPGEGCRCGASIINANVWLGQAPPATLLFDPHLLSPFPPGTQECAMRIYRYVGHFEAGGVAAFSEGGAAEAGEAALPVVVAFAEFDPPESNETQMLALRPGDEIVAMGQDVQGWMYGRKTDGSEGWFTLTSGNMLLRSSSRQGYYDYGTNAVRLNKLSEIMSSFGGWKTGTITGKTHPTYWGLNCDGGKGRKAPFSVEDRFPEQCKA